MRLHRRKEDGESQKALDEAKEHVKEAAARSPEVYQVAGALKRYRERNHFAEQIAIIMYGPQERKNH